MLAARDSRKQKSCRLNRPLETPGGLPYISHVGMCRPRSLVFAPFRSQNGNRFCSFCLESDMVSRKLRKCTNVFFVSIPNESETKGNIRIRNGF